MRLKTTELFTTFQISISVLPHYCLEREREREREREMSAGVPVKDENPEMERQIGCMNGILHLFDMHYFLNGRRVNQKRLPSGHNGNQLAEPKGTLQISSVKNIKVIRKKQRNSTESSLTSCSSSTPCSSFSSLDSSRSAQLEQPLINRTAFSRISTQHFLTSQTLNSQKFNQSINLPDALKNSIDREARGLSVKTVTSKPAIGHTIKHFDLPRLNQPPKFSMRRVSNSNVPQKVERTIGVNLVQVPKCSRRHSYDGRELHDTLKSSIKLKELPRLSLDSREYRGRCSTSGTRSSDSFIKRLSEQKEPENSKRPSTVIAKLMGLEAFPNSTSAGEYTISATPSNKPDPFSRSPDLKSNLTPNLSNGSAIPVQISLGSREVSTKSPRTASSVYGEIEKRLATLEFKESGKDLRALKQILDSMQKSKEMLDTKRKQASDVTSQSSNTSILDNSSELTSLHMRRNKMSDPARTPISPKSSRSPIINMKPVKITKKEGHSTSIGQSNKKVSGLQKLHIDHLTDNRRDELKSQILTDLSPRDNHPRYSHSRDTSSQPLSPREKRTTIKFMKVPQRVNEELPTTSGVSVTLSTRLHQKFGLEKQSSSNTPLSDSSSPRIQYIRHRTQPCSADTILQNKAPHLHQNSNAQDRKKGNEIRGLSQNKNASSLQSKSIPSLAQYIDQKGTSTYQKNSTTGFSGIEQMEEPPMPSFEQPSPVSVLDSTFYPDDLSPIKKKLYTFQDDYTLSVNEEEGWLECETQSPNKINKVDAETNHKKLENIQHLRKDLRQLKSTDEEKIADYIQLYNGRVEPHHTYISEILLASGLLRAFEPGLVSPPLHSSGHLINPNLFFALEKTQYSNWSSNDEKRSVNMPKSNSSQKAQRRLVFDTVNEILVGKTEARDSFKLNLMELCTKIKAHQLLKNLCAQVDQLQFPNPRASLNENDNYSQMLGYDDSVHQSRNWTGTQNEISGLVLDIERLIFKDLITEVVNSEVGSLQD